MTTTIGNMKVFGTTSYISIDDPYGVKPPVDDRVKGKQFVGSVPKEGPLNEAYFGTFQRLFENETYVDHFDHKDAPRKPGFLSSSPAARDEFALTRRADQHKEMLHKEEVTRKRHPGAKLPETEPTLVRVGPVAERFHAPEMTYDVGAKAQVSEPCMRCKKNMHRCPHKVANLLKDLDEFDPLRSRTTYHSYGANATSPASAAQNVSENAHRPIIATSFYRTQGVFPAK